MAISRRKRIAAAAAAVVVLGTVLAVNLTRDRRNRVTVQTDDVGREDLVSVVTASGEVKPQRFVDVSANVSGRITELTVQEGDRVGRGQVLARIDSERYQAGERQSAAALDAARAELRRAQADLENSRLGFERSKRLYEEKLISEQDFDRMQAEMRMKQAAVEAQRERIAQQQALLESNRDDLAKTTVVSPMDGVVTSLNKEEGEVVIGAQSFSPTVLMTVGDLSVMEVEVLVDETDIRNVALGQEATVRVDALGDAEIRGAVTEIGSSAIARGAAGATTATGGATQAKDFRVVVTLKDPPPALRPGLNATADIVTARRQSALAVPIQAVVVREVNKEGKVMDPTTVQAAEAAEAPEPSPGTGARGKGEEREGVFVVEGGQARFRPVKTGVMGETDIELLEGIQEGQEIVVGSYKTLRTLKDEARVKVEKGTRERQ